MCRYRQKRNARNFSRRISYVCRKDLADKRKREALLPSGCASAQKGLSICGHDIRKSATEAAHFAGSLCCA